MLVGLSRFCKSLPMVTLARHVGMFGILGYSSSTLEQVEIISLFGVSESLCSFAVSVTRAGNVFCNFFVMFLMMCSPQNRQRDPLHSRWK